MRRHETGCAIGASAFLELLGARSSTFAYSGAKCDATVSNKLKHDAAGGCGCLRCLRPMRPGGDRRCLSGPAAAAGPQRLRSEVVIAIVPQRRICVCVCVRLAVVDSVLFEAK